MERDRNCTNESGMCNNDLTLESPEEVTMAAAIEAFFAGDIDWYGDIDAHKIEGVD